VNAWDIFDFPFPWGTHPAVIVSGDKRVANKPDVVVLACRTMQPQTKDVDKLQAVLDAADGLDWKTICNLDLFFTVPKANLTNRRGSVSRPLRIDISRKMIQGLAIAGL